MREKHDEYHLLRELLKSWANNEILVKWLSRVFLPLQVGYIPRRKLPKLNAIVKEINHEIMKILLIVIIRGGHGSVRFFTKYFIIVRLQLF